ncbi:MAG: succinate dehydrogenase, cytochrome b556 subunit [Sphingomonas sp.]|nr:MAG: succinate dehydrogenase, cytochrome b556 subunit [Sphingomonas sp.]
MASSRPLSPHLSIWKWRVHAITSITHRVTGNGLAFVGLSLFAWWLAAAATSKEAYETFLTFATHPVGWLVWVGISWFFFQHLLSGIRHLLMDTGWGYELGVAKLSATWTWVGSVLLTAAFWGVVLFGRGII